ncbi:NYN domain-containing protein [Virgibacillus sp. W0181]|uniref:NYN domain-containing protein n=1 Tax=Virgibacillus sp. W0181 TaxID=3391581 RepID=UPI003F45AA20
MNILLVDGYNVIGAWQELQAIKQTDMEQARDRLIDLMAEYKAFTGIRVIIVFDAYYVSGKESTMNIHHVEVIFTKEKETADECIEKLIKSLKNIKNQVYVATSDYAEQRTIFSQGALRISARELLIELKQIQNSIEKKVVKEQNKKPQSKIILNKQTMELFEKWRRGKI